MSTLIRSFVCMASHMSFEIFMSRIAFSTSLIGANARFFPTVGPHMNPKHITCLKIDVKIIYVKINWKNCTLNGFLARLQPSHKQISSLFPSFSRWSLWICSTKISMVSKCLPQLNQLQTWLSSTTSFFGSVEKSVLAICVGLIDCVGCTGWVDAWGIHV